jgi:hypothetical protein
MTTTLQCPCLKDIYNHMRIKGATREVAAQTAMEECKKLYAKEHSK